MTRQTVPFAARLHPADDAPRRPAREQGELSNAERWFSGGVLPADPGGRDGDRRALRGRTGARGHLTAPDPRLPPPQEKTAGPPWGAGPFSVRGLPPGPSRRCSVPTTARVVAECWHLSTAPRRQLPRRPRTGAGPVPGSSPPWMPPRVAPGRRLSRVRRGGRLRGPVAGPTEKSPSGAYLPRRRPAVLADPPGPRQPPPSGPGRPPGAIVGAMIDDPRREARRRRRSNCSTTSSPISR